MSYRPMTEGGRWNFQRAPSPVVAAPAAPFALAVTRPPGVLVPDSLDSNLG